MQKLRNAQEEFEQLQEGWYDQMISNFYYGAVLLLLLEIIGGFLVQMFGIARITSIPLYSALYILMPSGLVFSFVTISKLILKNVKTPFVKQWTVVFCLLACCSVITTVHGVFVAIPVIFSAPLIITVIFHSKVLTWITAGVGVFMMMMSNYLAQFFDDNWDMHERSLNGLASVCFIMVLMIVCNIYVKYNKEKQEILRKASESQDVLREALQKDFLTGLYNHTEFYRRLDTELGQGKKNRRTCSVAVLDIDYFKRINDTYGHENGNQVLERLARILEATLGDFCDICRYGGEEFAVIAPGMNQKALCEWVNLARIRFSEEIFDFANWESITFSAGVAEAGAGAQSANDLFELADQALYEAKNAGRNQCKEAVKE